MTESKMTENRITEKLFYQDSHLRKFTAEVISCEAVKDRYEIETDRTAFFPEGGGQYADTGELGGVRVLDVREENGRIFHVADGPLEVGTTVSGRIDWEERFMKMQQHTGEHIVSGLVHSKFGYSNVGFHLGSEDCTMDFNGEITGEELREIELEANRAVWKNLEIQVLYPSASQAEHMEYRSKIEIEGQIRIVTVPGYDVCACCAPHVKRTGEIGLIKLTGMQRYKGGVRVTMLCGVRALSDYAVKQEQAADISALLCAKQNEIAEAVHHLRDECAGLKSQIVGKDRKLVMYQAEMVPDEEETVCIFSDDIEGENMRLLMNKVLERERKLCAVFHGDGSGGYRYVIGSRSADMRPFVKEFNAEFDGRGGGRPEMVQGTASGNEEDIKAWILEKAGSMQ